MTVVSPLREECERHAFRVKSSLASSRALKEAAANAHGRERLHLLNWAKRTEACAMTHRVRLVMPADGPSYISVRNSRACQGRWCMICAAYKARRQVAEAMETYAEIAQLYPGCRALFLTLTSKNRPATELRAFIRAHQAGLKRFFAYHRITQSTLGHFTNIEVDFSQPAGRWMCHVHSHSLIIVDAGALSDHRYIRHAEWRQLWRLALKLDYAPMVNIKALPCEANGLAHPAIVRSLTVEACKYTLDTEGYFLHENGAVTADPIAAAAFALGTHRLRLTSMDRVWLTAQRNRRQRRKTNSTNSEPAP